MYICYGLSSWALLVKLLSATEYLWDSLIFYIGNPYTGKTSLYWDSPLTSYISHFCPPLPYFISSLLDQFLSHSFPFTHFQHIFLSVLRLFRPTAPWWPLLLPHSHFIPYTWILAEARRHSEWVSSLIWGKSVWSHSYVWKQHPLSVIYLALWEINWQVCPTKVEPWPYS